MRESTQMTTPTAAERAAMELAGTNPDTAIAASDFAKGVCLRDLAIRFLRDRSAPWDETRKNGLARLLGKAPDAQNAREEGVSFLENVDRALTEDELSGLAQMLGAA